MNTFERDQELYRVISANYTGSQLARYLYAGTPEPPPGEPGEGDPPPVTEPEEDEGEEEKDPAA